MSSVSNEPVSTLPSCQGSSLVMEAQRLMTLSVNKIVASRSRRGGVSLHRNLLVAGVLFRARDALLAAGGKMSQPSSSTPSSAPSETSALETKQQQQQPDSTSDDDSCRTPSNPSLPPSADSSTSTTETCVGSAMAETKLCPHREIPVDTEDDKMDVEMVGKENVPPTATTSPAASELSKPASETEPFLECDEVVPQHQGTPISRKRSHSGSSPSCPIVEKSAKVVSPSESNSVQVSVGHTLSKNVACLSSPKLSSSSSSSSQSYSLSSSSSSNGRSSVSVNPVVYVNRVDVAFCSTSGIGGGVIGSIRPVFVVQVV